MMEMVFQNDHPMAVSTPRTVRKVAGWVEESTLAEVPSESETQLEGNAHADIKGIPKPASPLASTTPVPAPAPEPSTMKAAIVMPL